MNILTIAVCGLVLFVLGLIIGYLVGIDQR